MSKIKKQNIHSSKTNSTMTIRNKSICNNSNNYIKLLTKKNTLSHTSSSYYKYKKYISTLAHQFMKSQTTLVSSLFKVKNNTQFTITYNEISLKDSSDSSDSSDSTTYSIPHFIDIFRYLLTKNNYNNDFFNKFNLDEQKILKDKLSTNYTNKQCYTFLDTSLLGKKIISIYNSIINTSIINDLEIKYPSLKFHRLLINSFTSYKILEDLELNIKKLIRYSIVYEGKKINNFVYLFMYDNNNTKVKYTPNYIIELGTDIVKRILFFNKFLNTTYYPDKFILFLTDNQKEIDKELIEHLHFKTINVNTAVTDGNDIIIYREQELLKSIFHELIHFHNLDFRHVSPDILNNIISYLIKTHNIKENNEYLLYECITETLANILNNVYYSGTLKEMTINLENEIMFSTLQIAKILKICKYKRWSEFSQDTGTHTDTDTDNKKRDKSKQFKQDSCVFSYYILKLYIFLNLDTYFKHVLDSKMKFIQTKNSFDYLINIFDSSRKNIVLEDIINSILQGLYLNKNKHNHNHNHKNKSTKKKVNKVNKINKIENINTTLRMTCL